MSTALTLYDLEGELTELLSILDADAGEDEASLLKVLDDIAEKHEAAVAKRDNTIRFLQSVKAAIQLHKDEETRVRKRRQALENGLKRTEEYLIGIIEEHGTIPKGKKSKQLEGTIGSLRIQPNPKSVVIEDEALLPFAFMRAELKIDGSDWDLLYRVATESVNNVDVKRRLLEILEDAVIIAKKDLIKQTIEAGQEVAGADLKPGGYSLRIR